MIKKVLLISSTIILLTVYIVLFHTNLVSTPTYTLSDEIVLIIDDVMKEQDLDTIIEEDRLFIPIELLVEDIGIDIFWDEKNETAIYYDGERIIRTYPETEYIKINRDKILDKVHVYLKDGQPYISLDLVDKYSDYTYTFIKDTRRLIIEKKGLVEKEVTAIRDIRVRKDNSIWGEVLDIAGENEILFEYSSNNGWTYVRTNRGIFGYVRNDDLKVKRIIGKESEDIVEDIKSNDYRKINLTWDYIHRKTPSVDKLEYVEGLDVISPTWFAIENEKGTIIDKGSTEYMKWAHDSGYKVWGLFSNGFNPDITNTILNDSILREKVINDIIDLALYYRLDGINIDFENVYFKDKDMFTQFLKELTPIAKERNIILSIDVTAKSLSENWSLFYDREKIGRLLDYVILMAYDEHWAAGGKSGSVASMPWVERGIVTLLDEVPNGKVILGVPFYTRLWKEEMKDNKLKITSSALSMTSAAELLKKNNATTVWDEDAMQFYSEYINDDITYRIWLEDETSIKHRIELIDKYNLKGIASWRKGFEGKEIWNIIKENLN